MSPEAWAGDIPSPGFDFWALAVLLLEALGGRRLLDGAPEEVRQAVRAGLRPVVRSRLAEFPEPVSAFFERALASDPAERPTTGEAFRAQLDQLRGLAGGHPPDGFRT